MAEAVVRNKSLLMALPILLAIVAAVIIVVPEEMAIPLLFLALVAIVTIVRPYWGLAFLVALIPIEGLLVYSPVLSFMKGYGIFLALASLPVLLLERIRTVAVGRLPVLYLAFIAWSFASLSWAIEIEPALAKNFTYVSLFILYLLILYLPKQNDETLHLKAFVTGAFLSALTIPILGDELNAASARVAGGGLNANDYASILAIALPIALMWLRIEKNAWLKLIPLVFIPVGLLAIAYTKSRTGTLALVPFAIYGFVLFWQKGMARRFSLMALFLASVFVIVFFLPPGYIDRIKALDVEASERFTHRLDVWIAGKNMVLDNPILGVGAGNFPVLSRHYAETLLREGSRVAHNSLISVAGELGIVGLVLFVILLYSHARKVLQMKKDGDLKTITAGIFAAFAAYIIASMGLTWEYRKVLPLILGSIVLLLRKKRSEVS